MWLMAGSALRAASKPLIDRIESPKVNGMREADDEHAKPQSSIGTHEQTRRGRGMCVLTVLQAACAPG